MGSCRDELWLVVVVDGSGWWLWWEVVLRDCGELSRLVFVVGSFGCSGW